MKDKEYVRKARLLMRKMTLEEKIGQLNQVGASIYGTTNESGYEEMAKNGKVGSFLSLHDPERCNKLQRIAVEQSRLGIPLIFAEDVIHGLKTVFPVPLAESCSFEPELASRTAEVAADEASACGVKWVFAPMTDIARDARWGRIAEGSGEDPYIGSLFAAARVKGFQGGGNDGNIDEKHVAACVKHFACYGAAESGKDYNTVQLSDNNLYNAYLPPYKAAVDAGVLTVMTAFNDLNGTPCTVNAPLIEGILRKSWGFEGVVVSDWAAVAEAEYHGYCADRKDCAAEAIKAGVTVDMMGHAYDTYLSDLAKKDGKIRRCIDELCEQVLVLKYRLGLFDRPYADLSRVKDLYSQEKLDLAAEAARKSIVLLKNDGILPLKRGAKVLVTGGLATDKRSMLGCWCFPETQESTVDTLSGIKEKFAADYAAVPVDISRYSAIICVVGETNRETGEAASHAFIGLKESDVALVKAAKKTGLPVIALVLSGRPLALTEINDDVNALVECWHLGSVGGRAIADVLGGDFSPEGRLTASFPRETGQCPIYYSHFNTGRPYIAGQGCRCKFRDCDEGPLYPFGFGLTYTEFEYSEPTIENAVIGKNDKIRLSVKLKNTGKVEGTETVQVYFRQISSKPIRPMKSLAAFKKVRLAAGESRTVKFTLDPDDLGIIRTAALKPERAKGKCEIFVGANSEDCKKIEFVTE